MSETVLERWKRTTPHFTCPRCAAVSFNPNDLRERYCGRCRLFFSPPDMPSLRDGAPRDPIGVHRARKRAEEALRSKPHEAGFVRSKPSSSSDDSSNPFPTFPTPASNAFDPTPAADPAPSTIDPGGGDSGGGGASGDF
jgi:hypothetical protein